MTFDSLGRLAETAKLPLARGAVAASSAQRTQRPTPWLGRSSA